MKYSSERNRTTVSSKEDRRIFGDSNRLYGGNRDNGGLANVNYNWSDNRNDNIGFRPLVVSLIFISKF